MRNLFILLAVFVFSEGYSQLAVPARRPLILWADANDQDYYGYNGYYYGGKSSHQKIWLPHLLRATDTCRVQ